MRSEVKESERERSVGGRRPFSRAAIKHTEVNCIWQKVFPREPKRGGGGCGNWQGAWPASSLGGKVQRVNFISSRQAPQEKQKRRRA